MTRRPCPAMASWALSACLRRVSPKETGSPSVRIRRQRGRTVSGAPLQRTVGDSGRACTVVSRMRSASKGISSTFGKCRSGRQCVTGHFHERDLHGVAHEQGLAVLLARAEILAQGGGQEEGRYCARSRGPLAATSRESKASPRKRRLTVIRFCVRVPVLSVHMTVVEPCASTDGR
jgi:hypothetical protein